MKNQEAEEAEIVSIDSSVIEAQDRATIDIQIATAKKFPRNIKRATENTIALVTMDIDAAKTCGYSVPRGGKQISGPSVHLAKILAQQWGNMRIEAKVIAIDQRQIVSQAVAFDLETNLAVKVEVRRSIIGKTGQRYNDDLITLTGNAGNSIALRNAVYAVIPRAVVDKAYNASKQTITGDVSTESKMISRRKQVLDGLKDSYGVTEKEALGAIGKAAVSHITADDIVTLVGISQAIKDGDTTIEAAFKAKAAPASKEDKEAERVAHLINDAKTIADLANIEPHVKPEQQELFAAKEAEIKGGKK